MSDERVDELRETTLTSTRIYDGRVIRLRVDDVELPDGRRSQREVVEHRGAVGAVPITDDGQVLMVRQWRHPVGEAILEIPAGTREPSETAEECMRRELIEEVGYEAAEMHFLAEVFVSPGYSAESIHLFLATGLTPQTAQPDDDENIRVEPVPLDEALQMCRDGRIRDGKTVVGLLLAAPHVGH